MKVTILNPEVLENLYQNHGEFACTCYNTPDKYAKSVGKSCEKSGHMSGSRCEYIKFKISDLDRGTAEQCLRHEIGIAVPYAEQENWSFSDLSEAIIDIDPNNIVKNMASFRYIDKDGFNYTTPKNILKNSLANAKYNEVMEYLNKARTDIRDILIQNGVDSHKAVEDANLILPRATTTDFVIGFTPEALIHFMHKRLCVRAQEFISELAKEMKKAVAEYNEEFAKELVKHCEYLNWCPEGNHSCGAYPSRQELNKILDDLKKSNKE